MKFRLIRFNQEGEVVLDKPCITPNQYGDNHEWRDSGGKAVLIEYTTVMVKDVQGVSTNERVPKFYDFYAKASEFPEALWQLQTQVEVVSKHKYLEMLILTGAL